MPNYPFLTQRLWQHHKDPVLMGETVALLARQRDACDEVWLASDYGFPPLATHLAAADAMATAAAWVRAAGITASLQISNTLGHGSYLQYLDFSGIVWGRMVGADGGVAPFSNCPRDPDFHAYLDATTRAYCAWGPAGVWIDDDLRMFHHHPVDYGCFCPRCMAAFSAACGEEWTREALVAAITHGNALETRQAWLAFGRESLALVAGRITAAVQAAAPDCRMGLQHCDPCWGGYTGPDLAPVFETMARMSGKPVGSRPGGGFYIDHAPREMLGKALFIGLQNSRLPACVDDARAEVENLPGAVTGKSARGTAIESTLALAYGCGGLTFTPVMFSHEEFAWHERVLGELAAWRPFWLEYLAATGEARPAGVEIVLSRHQAHRAVAADEAPFAWASCHLGGVAQMLTTGLPLCWGAEAAAGALLHPHAAEGVAADEVRALLRRGLVTDGETIARLQRRGLGALLPLEVRPASAQAVVELLTDDALNGPYAGRTIELTNLSRAWPSYTLHPRGMARPLTHYRLHGAVADLASAAFETADGGRLVVFGNECWNPVVTTARRAQLLAAADWASGGHLPVRLDTPGQTVVVPRCGADGGLASVLVQNVSLDATPPLQLRLRRPRGMMLRWLQPREAAVALLGSPQDGEEVLVTLPPLAPWGTGALVSE
jgi:hypothetical protein